MAERRNRPPWLRLGTVAVLVSSAPALTGCGLFGGDGGGDGVSVFSVEPGQCFKGQTEVKAQLSTLTEVDCSQEHAQEAYAVLPFRSTDGSTPDTYPGDDVLTKFADGACAGAYKKYVGVDYLDSRLYYTYLLPSARSWEGEDRDVVCFVIGAGEPLRGSAKGSQQ